MSSLHNEDLQFSPPVSVEKTKSTLDAQADTYWIQLVRHAFLSVIFIAAASYGVSERNTTLVFLFTFLLLVELGVTGQIVSNVISTELKRYEEQEHQQN